MLAERETSATSQYLYRRRSESGLHFSNEQPLPESSEPSGNCPYAGHAPWSTKDLNQ